MGRGAVLTGAILRASHARGRTKDVNHGVELGQQAPDFTLPNHHGEPITLSSFSGRKNVVLIFYPWAFTGTCTSELCEIRDRLTSFDNDEHRDVRHLLRRESQPSDLCGA